MRTTPRVLLFSLLAGAALAACSGSFGAGSSVPQGAGLPSGPFVGASPSPTPNSATGILTYGRSTALQPLPAVGGYGGQIAFGTPAPKASGAPADDVSIGVTTSVVKPEAAPDLNLESGKGKHAKRRKNPARALFYITLLPTHDATLEAYPRIMVDVPRDIAAAYKDGDYGIAIYNEGEKNSAFRLAAAEREGVATPAPSGSPAAAASAGGSGAPVPSGSSSAAAGSAAPTATPAPSIAPSASPTARPSGLPPGSPTPSAAPTLPPQRITFAPTAVPLKLVANRAVVFAVYALPPKGASPSPAASAGTRAAARTSGSAAPSPVGSGGESGSPQPRGSAATAADVAVPSASGSPDVAASGSAAPVASASSMSSSSAAPASSASAAASAAASPASSASPR